MEGDSSIRTRCFLAVPQGEGRRGEMERLGLITYLKCVYRNAQVQEPRWDTHTTTEWTKDKREEKIWIASENVTSDWWKTKARGCVNPTKGKWLTPNYRQLRPSACSQRYFTWIMAKAKKPPSLHVPSVLQYIQPIMREQWYNHKVGSIFMSNPLPKSQFLPEPSSRSNQERVCKNTDHLSNPTNEEV